MKNLIYHKLLFVTVFILVVSSTIGQTCSSWLKDFSSISGECTALTTDSEHNLYALFTDSSTFLVKIDQDGNQLWAKPRPVSAEFLSMYYHGSSLYIMAKSDSTCLLYIYDQQGNQIAERSVPLSTISAPVKMIITDDGIYVAGKKKVARFKFDLTTDWTVPVDFDNQDLIDIAANGSGTVCVLSARSYEETIAFQINYTNANIVKITTNGGAELFSQSTYWEAYSTIVSVQGLVVFSDRVTYDVVSKSPLGGYIFQNATRIFELNGSLIESEATTIAGKLFYEPTEDIVVTCSVLDDNALYGFDNNPRFYIRDKWLNEQSHFVQQGNDLYNYNWFPSAIFSDGTNSYLAVKSQNCYLNQFYLGSETSMKFYIIKLTSDYCLIPDEPIYAGPDQSLLCGDQTMIGVEEFNPKASGDELFSPHTWDWREPDLQDNFNCTLTNPQAGYYHIKVTSGDCSVQDSVLISISKETNFSYIVNDKTITLTRIPPVSDQFSWDFGNGVTNNINPNPTYTFPNDGTYSVCLSGTGITSDCISCANITVPGNYTGSTLGGVGIEQRNLGEQVVTITPNPATDQCFIKYPAEFVPERVVLTDMNGKQFPVHFTLSSDGCVINTQVLVRGLYVVMIDDGHNVLKSRLLLQ